MHINYTGKGVRKNPNDAGLDVFATHDAVIKGVGTVRTGVFVDIPPGWCVQVWPKSRSNYLIGAGIIDAGYDGEVIIKIVGDADIKAGDPVAQLVAVPIGCMVPGSLKRDIVRDSANLI